MYRRRRQPNREIHFSFDSFLDVVANVVGIILRLILVAWVGARSYKAFVPSPAAPDSVVEVPADLPEVTDSLAPELDHHRRDLAAAQEQLLAELRRFEAERQKRTSEERSLESLRSQLESLTGQRLALEGAAREEGKGAELAALSADELRRRAVQLAEQVEALRKGPPVKKTLRYRTPVSHPVQSEEWMFECRAGHVALIDIGTLLDDAVRGAQSKIEVLRNQPEVSDVTTTVGPFRLRYTIERERTAFDAGAGPAAGPTLRAGLTSWEVEAVVPDRGETADAALVPTSEFRRVVDHLDPRQAAVTMWVYPDSFSLYRRLRDYLHERDIIVAARPLPFGAPIAASRQGTASRAQ